MENTDQKELRIQSECGKDGPEKTPYLDTFQAVGKEQKMWQSWEFSSTGKTVTLSYLHYMSSKPVLNFLSMQNITFSL